MPIIIDTNCFANVFSRSSSKHADFEPVLNWVLNGKGLIVYGGTQYKKELSKSNKYQYIFRLLKQTGKVIDKCDEEIDAIQAEIEEKVGNKDFDDIHLLAICLVTKCRIICSEDVRSIKFVCDKEYFPKGFKKPVYYTSEKNKDLLCDKYVSDNFKPLCKIKNAAAQKIYQNL